MMIKYNQLILFFILLLGGCCNSAYSQQIRGVVTDSITNEPLPYISIYYKGTGIGAITDLDGKFTVDSRNGLTELTFSAVGYLPKLIKVVPGVTNTLNVKLRPDDIMLQEVVVKPKKERYSRKNNPAVEMMKKVIAAKKKTRLEENDYYQYDRYQKITMSLNEVTPEMLEKGVYKKMPFLKDQIELCEETKKLILPISVDETASQQIYRKNPKSEKTIIKGISSTGVNELFATGDMLSTLLKDIFTDVNIYDNDIRLLQYPFISPISSSDAISFYRYYIMDTTYVERDKCFHLTFVPNNSQDFGFTGHLYIMADSTYRVKKCTMNLPYKTGIDFYKPAFHIVTNLSVVFLILKSEGFYEDEKKRYNKSVKTGGFGNSLAHEHGGGDFALCFGLAANSFGTFTCCKTFADAGADCCKAYCKACADGACCINKILSSDVKSFHVFSPFLYRILI